MHRRIVVTLAVVALGVGGMAGCKKQAPEQAQAPAPAAAPVTAPVSSAKAAPAGAAGQSGEALYKQHCAACHPDGGNSMNPKKTLHAKDMAANNIKTADDIVKLMRTPGPGMTKFDTTVISDDDAKKIADYVQTTFH